MKFGGTSVGDAACISRVAEILQKASRDCNVVAVVSAMSGVTNKLVEAANRSKAGDGQAVAAIFNQLRRRHEGVVASLIKSADQRRQLQRTLNELFLEGESVCQETLRAGELTPQALDAISGLGERLCAPVVATVLRELGVASEAIEATELVVTDSSFGAAEPLADPTRVRCQNRVTPLLRQGIVPVVTGFIGATEDGVATTLGRGGSDYSATILGASLDADEVVIWSDVTGILTADPKLVEDARTIAEISYREAAELAHYGAKVLHPKTMRPVLQRRIPLLIKNSFAPEEVGTKVTFTGSQNSAGVKSLAVLEDAVLISVAGSLTHGITDILPRTIATVAAVHGDVLLVLNVSAHSDICLVVPSAVARCAVEALRGEIEPELKHRKVRETICESAVSVITLVGHGIRQVAGDFDRTVAALAQECIKVIATVQGSSDSSLSFVVQRQDMTAAIGCLHREFELSVPAASSVTVTVETKAAIWEGHTEQISAD
jgi:bifunctional aspartokinase / homoserine dehydrogenase 1